MNGQGKSKSNPSRRLKVGLAPRLVGLAVCIALVTGALVGAVLILNSRAVLREHILESNFSAAHLAAEYAANYIKGAETNLLQFARRPLLIRAVLEKNLPEAEMHLAQILDISELFESASIYNVQGVGWASGLKDKWQNRGGTVADREWFQWILATRLPYFGIPTVSRGTGLPAALYAVPIFEADGTFKAVLIGGISLAVLSRTIGGLNVSRTARVSLLDTRQGGLIIAHPDPKLILTPVRGRNQAELRALAGEQGDLEIQDNGEAVLAAFTPVPGLPWSILILEPLTSAYAPLDSLTLQAILYVAAIVLLSVILGIFLARSIVRPVRELVKGTDEIGRGNLEIRIETKSRTEIGQLAEAFNQMTYNLKTVTASRDDLDREISERQRVGEALRASELRYRRLFESAKDGILILDAETGRIVDVNPYLIELLGFSQVQITDKKVWELGFFRDVIANRDNFLELQRKDFIRYEDLPLETHDGRKIEVEFVSNVYDVNGRKVIQCNIRNITERKIAEREIRSLARFPAENPAPVLRITGDGLLAYANPAAYRFIDGEMEVGKPAPVFLRTLAAKALENNTAQFIETERSRHVFSITAAPFPDTGYVNLYGIDITDQKRAMDALQKSESYLSETQKMAHLGQWTWDVKTGAVDWSEEVFRIFRQDPDTFNPRIDSILAFSPWPEDHERDRELIRKATESREQGDYEQRFLRPDGSDGYYYSTFQGKYDDAGALTAIIGTVMDITERKKAEIALRSLTNRLETLLSAVPEIVMEVDAQKVYTWANQAGVEFFGDDVLGREASFYFEGEQNIYETVQPLFDGSRDDVYVENFQRRRDGETRLLAWRCRALRDGSGRVSGALSSARDITEEKQLQREILKLNVELEQRVEERTIQLKNANRELEAFAYSVSHDLRAPLRAIDGFTEILLEDYEPSLDAEGKRVCSVICENTRRMGQLIDDLLAFSRLGKTQLSRALIDMKKAALRAYEEALPPDERKRVDFRVDDPPDAPGDLSMIRQVWANLISNAVKFSSKRERAVLTVTGKTADGMAVYCVRDNGTGFDMRHADKLFGVFQRLHGRNEFEGTGVGLAIVKRIVERHGGRVWAESEPDKGAAFYFSLPLETDRAKGEPNG